jgi:hypothetical protein
VKGQRWPYYYGIQPAGRYPDQPFIRELYYDSIGGDIAKNTLKQVPIPVITPPTPPLPTVVQTPTVVETPQVVQPAPTPPPVIIPTTPPTTGPGIR